MPKSLFDINNEIKDHAIALQRLRFDLLRALESEAGERPFLSIERIALNAQDVRNQCREILNTLATHK